MGPQQVLSIVGIELDTLRMTARLPEDKGCIPVTRVSYVRTRT